MVKSFVSSGAYAIAGVVAIIISDEAIPCMFAGGFFTLSMIYFFIGVYELLERVRKRRAQIRKEKLRAKRKETYEAALRIISSETAKMCDVCPLSFFCKDDSGGICPICGRLEVAAREEIEKIYSEGGECNDTSGT